MMKPLAVTAIFGAIAQVQAVPFQWLNPIPTNVAVGSEIVLEWVRTGYTGQFELAVFAFNTTPISVTPGNIPLYDDMKVVLANPTGESGSFTWKAEPVDSAGAWTGQSFLYQIDANYPDQSYSSAGAFYLET